jgi:hypothetical protein
MQWLSVPPRSAFSINEVTSALDAAAGNTSLGKQTGPWDKGQGETEGK